MTDQPKPQSKREEVEGLLRQHAESSKMVSETGSALHANRQIDSQSRILSIVEELEREVHDLEIMQGTKTIDALSAELATLRSQGEGECIWEWAENLGLWMTRHEDPDGWPRTFSKQERHICCPLCGKRIQST